MQNIFRNYDIFFAKYGSDYADPKINIRKLQLHFSKISAIQISIESLSLSLKYFIVAKSIGNVMQFWQKKCIGVSSSSKSVYFAAGCNQIDFFLRPSAKEYRHPA